MKRMYQTILVSIALLFGAQAVHAVGVPGEMPFPNKLNEPGAQATYSFTELGNFTAGESATSQVEHNDSYYISWFQFTTDATADLTLTTHGSVDDIPIFNPPVPGVLDTILALFDYSFDADGDPTTDNGNMLASNDNCSVGVSTSCLTISSLAAGSYLAGVSTPANSPFASDWGWNSNVELFGTVQLNVNPVPVPAAFWLFASALIGFVGMSRRTSVKT